MTTVSDGYEVPSHLVPAMRRFLGKGGALRAVIDTTPEQPPALDRWTRLRRRWASKHVP